MPTKTCCWFRIKQELVVNFSCVIEESVLKVEVARTGESSDLCGATAAVAAAGQTGTAASGSWCRWSVVPGADLCL